MDVKGKVFVVTGGGNGMGREVVLGLIARGAKVAAVDLREEGLEETAALAKAPKGALTTHVLDVTKRQDAIALPERVIAAHGQVDGILNIAGIIQKFVKIQELSFEEIEKVMNVNFWGVVNMTKAFLPHLLARPEAAVLNVSSMGGFLPVPGQAAYGASKAAVKLFTEALYAETRGTGVQVTVVFPGGVGTNITKNSGVDIPNAAELESGKQRKTTSPADAGRQIIEGVEKASFRVVIGGDASFLDKLSRLAPRKATEFIAKQMKSLLG
ncbi:MAG: SDR family oxidoreductase [Microbacteriaceae bacterium]|nr:SDR family oxidoreductase [Cryobacterium sp.]MBX3103775.1 SDR family oxidoreductase [Cryobacterium sp.]MCC6377102.1 SDR family oxidoreductase [Microbacteriaceae bacterium]